MALDPISAQRTPSVTIVTKPEFDPDQARYQCCCGCCHVTTGVQLIGILELALLAFQLVAISVVYAETSDRADSGKNEDPHGDIFVYYYRIFEQNPRVSLAAGIFSAVIGFTVITLMFFGVKRDKPSFIIPHIICQILAVLGLLAAGGLIIHGALTVSDRIGTVDKKVQWTALVVLLTFLALFLVAVVVVIYFIFVVIRGYKFLKERLRYESALTAYMFYYNHQNRQPSMAPSRVPSLTMLNTVAGNTPRGSYAMLHPMVGNSPHGSYTMLHPMVGNSPRGSYAMLHPVVAISPDGNHNMLHPNSPRGSYTMLNHLA